jgi:hypothetical protein
MTEQERDTVFNLRCKWLHLIPAGMADDTLLSLYCDFAERVNLCAGRLPTPEEQEKYRRLVAPLFIHWLPR